MKLNKPKKIKNNNKRQKKFKIPKPARRVTNLA